MKLLIDANTSNIATLRLLWTEYAFLNAVGKQTEIDSACKYFYTPKTLDRISWTEGDVFG